MVVVVATLVAVVVLACSNNHHLLLLFLDSFIDLKPLLDRQHQYNSLLAR